MIVAVVALSAAVANCPPAHTCVSFEGKVSRGERLSRRFGAGLTLVLEPIEHGWEIVVRDDRPSENIARLTPPFHFVPNPRYIEGWHFRNAGNTGPNDGSVNAPQQERNFIFSVEVGRSIDYPPAPEQVAALREGGQGHLVIKSYELNAPLRGQRAVMTHLVFSVLLSWPSSWVAIGHE